MSVCSEKESFFHSRDDTGRHNVDACMQKFRLYETQSMFYMIGRDKSRTYWRLLKIDRLDPSELNVHEDSATYTESECSELLRRVHEGNKSTGGLKFVTTCYGIVGFIKFLGPYYMLLITRRREIGIIYGHTVYAISKIEMIPVPNSTLQSAVANSRDESRYKKLLCMVDLTKDFFFSYSYHVMRSLQKNLCDSKTGQVLYETMFVWNEFLTRGIRNHLQSTLWTVALVYGFFKQVTLSIAGRDLKLTLIARRSRHNAGTRYLKRGVNEEGRVANDVETEQIVFEDVPEGFPTQISSVIQNRGSIPLFWSQETSRLNLKPDIILSKKDQNYEATRLHFENLVKRYGNPIVVLNLIKTEEKRPRESILRAEFASAINSINKDMPEENHLKFLHWDLHKHSQSKAINALSFLSKVSAYALTLTGFFYCHISSAMRPTLGIKWPSLGDVENSCLGSVNNGEKENDIIYLKRRHSEGNNIVNGTHFIKPPMFQRGVLRTNCIDCLDRTNAAQYAYGLATLGRQLHALGVIEYPKIDLNTSIANELMGCYERMGDTLAHQYGGSAAHNKIFSAIRGQWKAATQSQEFFRTLQRYYNNAYMDAVKQDAINVFLGNFQPEQGRPALWELSDQDLFRNAERNDEDDRRLLFKRCLSDGSILKDTSSPMSETEKQQNLSGLVPHNQSQGDQVLFGSSPDISTLESEITFLRCTPEMPKRLVLGDVQRESNHICYSEYGDLSNYSNFVDLDWLSSSGNSCDEDAYERSSVLTSSSVAGLLKENVINGIGSAPSTNEHGSNMKFSLPQDSANRGCMPTMRINNEDVHLKERGECNGEAIISLSYDHMHHANVLENYSDSLVKWVNTGETLCH